jgi:hypothetical protein
MSFEQLEHSADRPPRGKFILGLLCALLCAGGLIFGYYRLMARHNETQTVNQTPAPTPLPAPLVQVSENEPRLQGTQALISGAAQNTSSRQLTELSAVIELKQRNAENKKEQRSISLTPAQLQPGQTATYRLSVPWSQFSAVKLIAIQSQGQSVCAPSLQKCLSQGKLRPREEIPDQLPAIKKTAPAPVKPTRPKGDETINTPETADPY